MSTLKKLFVSKVRIEILSLYLHDFDASFHVRGLTRELNEEINAIRREVANLEDVGILKSQKEGNKLVYRLNKKSPILYELRTIFYKESEIGQKLYNALKGIEGIDCVILTDSFIKNKYNNNTDVDFLFIGSMKVREISTAMNDLEKELERDLRYSVITKEDFEFARKKREAFLMNILENDKIIMLGKQEDLL